MNILFNVTICMLQSFLGCTNPANKALNLIYFGDDVFLSRIAYFIHFDKVFAFIQKILNKEQN